MLIAAIVIATLSLVSMGAMVASYSVISGWLEVQQAYPSRDKFRGSSLGWLRFGFGLTSFGNTVGNLGLDEDGIHIWPILSYARHRKCIFIPWDDVSVLITSPYLVPRVEVQLKKLPDFPLWFHLWRFESFMRYGYDSTNKALRQRLYPPGFKLEGEYYEPKHR